MDLIATMVQCTRDREAAFMEHLTTAMLTMDLTTEALAAARMSSVRKIQSRE